MKEILTSFFSALALCGLIICVIWLTIHLAVWATQ